MRLTLHFFSGSLLTPNFLLIKSANEFILRSLYEIVRPKHIASMILLFPPPFGPTIQVKSINGPIKYYFWSNDLKLFTFICDNFIIFGILSYIFFFLRLFLNYFYNCFYFYLVFI